MIPSPPTRAPRVRVRHPAAELLPVARVALMTPVPHLDRVFDYEVPERLAADAVPWVRLRVRRPVVSSTASSLNGRDLRTGAAAAELLRTVRRC